MGRGPNVKVIATAGIIISMFFFILRYPTIVNIDPATATTLFNLIPAFIIIAISIYVTAETRGGGKLGGCLGLGIGLCYLLNAVDGEGLITAEMLSGLTVIQLQTWTMILATIFGFILYGASRQ